jgi:hypothetical protein
MATPVILTWKAKIRRMDVRSQPGQIVHNPSQLMVVGVGSRNGRNTVQTDVGIK